MNAFANHSGPIDLASGVVEQWLRRRLNAQPSDRSEQPLAPLTAHSPQQRMRLMRAILERRPDLADVARHLELADQLRLTLELVRCGEPSPPTTCQRPVRSTRLSAACRRMQRGRPRTLG
jgi:hypothetical protein